MNSPIRVRLVPKNREGEAVTYQFPSLSAAMARRFAPDQDRAESACAKVVEMGIEAAVTSLHAVNASMGIDTVESVFKTKLIERKTKTSENIFSALAEPARTYMAPSNALVVPDELKETIAFAYVPTPPEFCAVSYVPPNASVYHLRLSDVQRALAGGPCHRRGWTGRGVRVAMTDSGFARHPYFDHHGYNMRRVATPLTSNPAEDESGHGTGECANVMVMAPDCEFVGVKHNDYSVDAIETAIAQDPRVITNSWGWNIDDQTFEQLKASDENLYNEIRDIERTITEAVDDGIVVLFAAGNGHRMFPACMPGVIAIGGTTVQQDGELEASSYASSFRSVLFSGRRVPDVCGVVGESGTGNQKGHIMLPVPNGSELEGTNMPISQSNKGWGIFSGTSAATPQVAGIVALMLGINPTLTGNQIRDILSDTATDVTDGTTGTGDSAHVGPDNATGAGFADAFRACLRADLLRQGEPADARAHHIA